MLTEYTYITNNSMQDACIRVIAYEDRSRNEIQEQGRDEIKQGYE